MKSIDENTLKFLSENPDEYYFDDTLAKYQFVNNKLRITDAYFNSKAQMLSWHEKMIKESSNYPVLEDLEESWGTLEANYKNISLNVTIRDDACAMTPFNAFRYFIESGIYPPPEVLLAIDECLNLYMDLGGKIELEEVFFGTKKSGVGNYSARQKNDEVYKEMLITIALNKVSDSNNSLAEIAEELINSNNLNNDVDSFLRGFRRYLKRKNLKMVKNDKDTKPL